MLISIIAGNLCFFIFFKSHEMYKLLIWSYIASLINKVLIKRLKLELINISLKQLIHLKDLKISNVLTILSCKIVVED